MGELGGIFLKVDVEGRFAGPRARQGKLKSKQGLPRAGGAGDERSAPAPHTTVEHLVQSRNPSPDSLSFGAVLLGDGWAHQPGVDLESRGRDVNSVQALEVPAAPEFAHPHETLVGGGALLPGKLDN